MSITPELRASARSTYRLLFRTAATTFKGDDHVLNAFREKVRTEFRDGRSIVEAEAFTSRIQLGREVAAVLRKNIVQGVKVDSLAAETHPGTGTGVLQAEGGVWRLKLTQDTELGSNDSIKLSSSSSKSFLGGCCQSQASSSASTPSSSSASASVPSIVQLESKPESHFESEPENLPDPQTEEENQQAPKKKINFSTLKRLSQTRIKPTLNEDDLEESFVRGSGPGGQSINKTENNVQLLHKPTGIRVTCQETRSLQQNRTIARKNLLEKLDQIANPGLSKEDLKRAKQIERERRRRKKARKRAKAKEKDNEDEDDE